MAAPAAPDPAALEAALRRLVRDTLGARVGRVEWLVEGLGLRRFARVHLSGGDPPTLVARIEAPEDPAGRPAGTLPEPPLEPIRALLERSGLPVPRRLGGDAAAGIELLEDVGSLPLAAAAGAAGAEEQRALYQEACDLVPRIQRIADPGGVAAFGRRLDDALLAYKADLFCEWVVAPRAGAAAGAAARAAFARIAEEVRAAPLRLAHRDLQAANVHVRAGRPPGARLVLIDLQGAFLAPPEYDLVCLLRDSYVELPAEEVAHQLARIRPRLPEPPGAEEFARRFDLLTLSRKGKDLARFLYAARARGDDRYLRFAPATLRTLRAAAARAAARDAAFAALAEITAALAEDPCAR
jgi:aminoglycoside/choline kinase family phosphotransferase